MGVIELIWEMPYQKLSTIFVMYYRISSMGTGSEQGEESIRELHRPGSEKRFGDTRQHPIHNGAGRTACPEAIRFSLRSSFVQMERYMLKNPAASSFSIFK